MSPGLHNFEYVENTTWGRRVRDRDDLGEYPTYEDGWTAQLAVRGLIEEEEPILLLTTENGGITIGNDEAGGYVDLHIDPGLAVDFNRSGVYDLFLFSPLGVDDHLLTGNFRYVRSAVRDPA